MYWMVRSILDFSETSLNAENTRRVGPDRMGGGDDGGVSMAAGDLFPTDGVVMPKLAKESRII